MAERSPPRNRWGPPRVDFLRTWRTSTTTEISQSFKNQIQSPANPRAMPTKLQIIAWSGILLLSIGLSLRDYDSFQLGIYRDDAHYVVLAESLVSSDEYGYVNMPGRPGTAEYPFGYPLLLAPVFLLSPENLEVLKFPSLLVSVINASLLFWGWRWISRSSSYWWALAVTGAYSLTPMTIAQSRMVMSEPFFMMFCIAALMLAEQAARGDQGRLWYPALGVTLLLALFTRTVGVILLLCIPLYLLWARGWRFWTNLLRVGAWMSVTLLLLVALTPIGWQSVIPARYIDEFTKYLPVDRAEGAATEVAPENPESVASVDLQSSPLFEAAIHHVSVDFRQAVLPLGGGLNEQALAHNIRLPILPTLAGILISSLIALGLFRWYKRDGLSSLLLFTLLYLGFMFLWLWRGTRFLYPVQPMLVFGFLLGVNAMLEFPARSFRKAVFSSQVAKGLIAGFVLALMAVSVVKSLAIEDTRAHTGDLEERTAWLKANSGPLAVVMTEEPQADYIYSGRRTVPYPKGLSSAAELQSYLRANEVDLVLVAPSLRWQPTYVPVLSAETKELLTLVDSLVAEGGEELIYSSERDKVKVFASQP